MLAKEVTRLWKRDKLLLVLIAAGLLALGYYVYQQQQAPAPAFPASAGPDASSNLPVTPQSPVTGSNVQTPIIPYNALPAGTRYATAQDLQNQPTLTWMGITYNKVPGQGNLLYGNPTNGGQQVLLYGPPSAY